MKKIFGLILSLCMISCSIQGNYYLRDATDEQFSSTMKIKLKLNQSGYICVSDTTISHFTYNIVNRNSHGSILKLEFLEDVNTLKLYDNIVWYKNRLFLEDINHNNYYFVKIPPLTLKSPIIPKSKISPVCHGITRQGNENDEENIGEKK